MNKPTANNQPVERLFPYHEAFETALKLVSQIQPCCDKVAVAGSLRRKKREVHDIDLVVICSKYWELENKINQLVASGAVTLPKTGGPPQSSQITFFSDLPAVATPRNKDRKWYRFSYGNFPVDIYFANPRTWSTLLLIRTGSAENNQRLCAIARNKGWHLSADGEGLFNGCPERIAGDTEESIYHALALPYQRPEDREVR